MNNRMETRNSLKTLKFRNRRLVLSFMRGSGAVSVNEISRATGLSKMTVHKIIDHYLEEGMITHAGKGFSTEEGGKKPNLFSFNAYCRYIFAVRLGNKVISTSIVNLKGELVVERRRIPAENLAFDAAAKLIAEAFTQQMEEGRLPREDCLAAVVGCNGIVDTEAGVCVAAYQYPSWGFNIPIREALQNFLPQNVQVYVESWWRHLAYGEMHFAEGENRRRFFLIGNSGDYVSGGMVNDGLVYSGATGFAGEIGHMIVESKSEAPCVCGGVGCLESLITPVRVLERAAAARESHPESLLFSEAKESGNLDFSLFCSAAERGDGLARRLMDEVVGWLAVAINNVVQICDPGTVVLFGDYAQAGEYFLSRLRETFEGLNLRDIDKRTQIERSVLADEHGVVGAANHMTDFLFAGGR